MCDVWVHHQRYRTHHILEVGRKFNVSTSMTPTLFGLIRGKKEMSSFYYKETTGEVKRIYMYPLKIETRLRDERLESVKGEIVL